MKDCNGVTIRDRDRVEFQFERKASRPALPGVVLDATSARARRLDAVLFLADAAKETGNPQFVGGKHLRVLGYEGAPPYDAATDEERKENRNGGS
jgi:hypothetical protein